MGILQTLGSGRMDAKNASEHSRDMTHLRAMRNYTRGKRYTITLHLLLRPPVSYLNRVSRPPYLLLEYQPSMRISSIQRTSFEISTSYGKQNTAIANVFNAPQSADLDFDLIWPDSEDLFETLMAWENSNQWQMPFTALPITSHTLQANNSIMEQRILSIHARDFRGKFQEDH